MRWSRRTLLTRSTAVGALFVLAACGVPEDDHARRVAPEDVPFGLVEVSAPPDTSATAAPVQSTVELFYVDDEGLVPRAGDVDMPLTPESVVAALSAPLEPAAPIRTVLDPSDILSLTVEGRQVTIDLDRTLLELPTTEQVLAIGQLVMTLCGLLDVDAVAFTSEDQPVAVPLPDGTAAARPVTQRDFASLVTHQSGG